VTLIALKLCAITGSSPGARALTWFKRSGGRTGEPERILILVAQLLDQKVDINIVGGTANSLAAKKHHLDFHPASRR